MKLQLSIIFLLAAIPHSVVADGPPSSGGPYTIERYTIDTGGGESSGGGFTLRGTSGQHDVGEVHMGGAYDLRGGFWAGINNPKVTIFRDSLESGVPQ